MIDLRKIAEGLRIGQIPLHEPCNKEIATLLNALVEQRTNFILEKRKWAEGTQYSKGQPVNVPDRESCRTQALEDLNLKDVWPKGEKI